MKESIKKFRDEAKRLEESEALQEARKKYVSLPQEFLLLFATFTHLVTKPLY